MRAQISKEDGAQVRRTETVSADCSSGLCSPRVMLCQAHLSPALVLDGREPGGGLKPTLFKLVRQSLVAIVLVLGVL